jgi:hypothetical protein
MIVMCHVEFQGVVLCRVPRHFIITRCRLIVGRDRTVSDRSQGDKTDGEGRDRDGDCHAEAVHGHNASQVYAANYIKRHGSL